MRLAFVVPRYGAHVVGGAETLARRTASMLQSTGHEVSVLTLADERCAAGSANDAGVHVQRFALVPPHNSEQGQRLRGELLLGKALPIDAQYDWLSGSPHAPALYAALAQRSRTLDAVLLLPYLAPVIQFAAAISPRKAVLWPCLHEENEAYLAPTHQLLNSCAGILYNSPAERRLAEDKLGAPVSRGRLIGIGIDAVEGNAARFRTKYGIADPFLLYAGRISPAKNTDALLRYFVAYKQAFPGPLKLLLIGAVDGVDTRAPEVLSLGFLNESDKHDAFAAALALCQPSLVESFSIVLMESWAAGRPVLVHARCDVTSEHVAASGGGLVFDDSASFATALSALHASPETADHMGCSGRAYVAKSYQWPAVLTRLEQALRELTGVGIAQAGAR
jgi:glycosyltransferase involved in cell wall biosynthesis